MYLRLVYTPRVPKLVEKIGTISDRSLLNFLLLRGAIWCARSVLEGKHNLNENPF